MEAWKITQEATSPPAWEKSGVSEIMAASGAAC